MKGADAESEGTPSKRDGQARVSERSSQEREKVSHATYDAMLQRAGEKSASARASK